MLLMSLAFIYFQINMQRNANGKKPISLCNVSFACISRQKYLNPPIEQDTTNCTGEEKGAHIQTVLHSLVLSYDDGSGFMKKNLIGKKHYLDSQTLCFVSTGSFVRNVLQSPVKLKLLLNYCIKMLKHSEK